MTPRADKPSDRPENLCEGRQRAPGPIAATRVAMAADHAGLFLKNLLADHLKAKGVAVEDLGVRTADPVDYPDYAKLVAGAVSEGRADRGILVCGSGIGMSISANRFKGIRAALCHDHFTAAVSRAHNDANILCLGGRILGPDLAKEILDTWLDTPFEGGRHARRVSKLEL